jgi:hypothetical protein
MLASVLKQFIGLVVTTGRRLTAVFYVLIVKQCLTELVHAPVLYTSV